MTPDENQLKKYRALIQEMKTLRSQIEAFNKSEIQDDIKAAELETKRGDLLDRYYSGRFGNVQKEKLVQERQEANNVISLDKFKDSRLRKAAK